MWSLLPAERIHFLLLVCGAFCFAGCANSCFVGYSVNGNGGIIVKGGDPPPACNLNQAQGMVRAAIVKTPACDNCAPVATVQHMFVVLRGIQLHSEGDTNDSAWFDLAPALAVSPRQVDLIGDSLLELTDTPATLPAGSYDRLKLQFAADATNDEARNDAAQTRCGAGIANCLVMGDGRIEPLRFSTDESMEMILPLEGQTTSLLVLPQSAWELRIHLGARPIDRALDSTSGRPSLLAVAEVVARAAATPN